MEKEEENEEISRIGTWAQRERRLIVEWAYAKYTGAKMKFNVPIGRVPPELIKEVGFEKATRMYQPVRKKVDCLIFLPEKLIVAEAELARPLEAIRDLYFYEALLKDTPDLLEWREKPHELVLVIPYSTEEIERLCKQFNINIEIFKPKWVEKYMQERMKYFTKEGMLERMERKRRMGLI